MNERTEKLYYEDAYIKNFNASVTACRQTEKGFAVSLERTAFYPEGGGQPGDTGIFLISDDEGCTVHVADTQEEDGVVWHYTDKALPEGAQVTGVIDWERRFTLMQGHSGEHLVSGIINGRYGFNNVGFHMGSECITIDFDGIVPANELPLIETAANRAIWADTATRILDLTEDEASNVTYRSKKELHDQIRVVVFEGTDSCACCGLHVKRTGEIGIIKFISYEHLRGGVRIGLLCGGDALDYIQGIYDQNHKISVSLSAMERKTSEAVERLKEADNEKCSRLIDLENRYIRLMAKSHENSGGELIFEKDSGNDLARKMADAVMKSSGGLTGVFAGSDETGYRYAVGCEGRDIAGFIKEMNERLNGRGGGRGGFAQGSVKSSRSSIEEFWNETTLR